MYHYLLESEGRLQSFMPFPNEDNYFPRSQSLDSGQSSQAGRQADVCIEMPCVSATPYDKNGEPGRKKKIIENHP